MARIAQTQDLTDFQRDILATVRTYVDREIIPAAQELEHTDTYPDKIVADMRAMGLFGLMIPEEYGGLGESLLTYALCVEELARGWMSVSGVSLYCRSSSGRLGSSTPKVMEFEPGSYQAPASPSS